MKRKVSIVRFCVRAFGKKKDYTCTSTVPTSTVPGINGLPLPGTVPGTKCRSKLKLIEFRCIFIDRSSDAAFCTESEEEARGGWVWNN